MSVSARRAPEWVQTQGVQRASIRCPSCRHVGVLEAFGADVQISDGQNGFRVGYRRCPKDGCHQFIVVYFRTDGTIEEAYPRERLDLDTDGIPDAIVDCLEESLTCHAEGCYRAAAMMVRRSIEVLCDLNNAQGGNLKARVAALGTKVVIAKPLLEGMDHLRLLGNDAAHVNASDYEEIGAEELTLAIDVTKEIMKAVYQNAELVARLEALKSRSAAE